jgi:AcrR family transcriptional regulator
MGSSTGRRQQALLTRQRIRDSARELFLARGYTEATVTEIARAAAVAPQTVYFIYGSKAAVLSAVIDAEIVGDLDPVPLLERPAFQRLATIAESASRLRRVVALLCEVTERVAPVYEIARGGSIDPDVRTLLDKHEEQRRETHRTLVGLLAEDLQTGLSADEAADRLYALVSHDMYWLLVERCAWTTQRWRRLAQQEAARQLLRA